MQEFFVPLTKESIATESQDRFQLMRTKLTKVSLHNINDSLVIRRNDSSDSDTVDVQLDDDTLTFTNDVNFRDTYYWDTSSQLTSFQDDDEFGDAQVLVSRAQNLDIDDESHSLFETFEPSPCQKAHQSWNAENDIKPDLLPSSDSYTGITKLVRSNYPEQEEMDFGNNHYYSTIYEEVLQSLESMDQIGELPLFKESCDKASVSSGSIPESPSSAVSSIFSGNHHHQHYTRTPESATSSKFTVSPPSPVAVLEKESTKRLLPPQRPQAQSRASRLLKKLSRNFSSTSLASLDRSDSVSSVQSKKVSQLEPPASSNSSVYSTHENPNFIRSASNRLKHRLSVISFHEAKPTTIPQVKKAQSVSSLKRPVAGSTGSPLSSSSISSSSSKARQKNKVTTVRSVANTTRMAPYLVAQQRHEFHRQLQPAPVVQRGRDSLLMLKRIEETIGDGGADSDPDYLAFKRQYM